MFTQYSLPYGFADLEPHIDQLTMETHYTKHHAAYTNNLNAAVEKDSSLAGKSIEEILSNLDAIKDEGLRTTIRNNGGGFVNHNLYFSTLSPNQHLHLRVRCSIRSKNSTRAWRAFRKSLPSKQPAVSVQVGHSWLLSRMVV